MNQSAPDNRSAFFIHYNFRIMLPCIFLDRDGVLIEFRRDYVRNWDDVVIYPGAVAAIAQLKTSGYRLVIITNQSAIGRGLVSAVEVGNINQRITAEITKAGGHIDGVYVCPHKPQDECACRKPNPGLILQAARELNIDLRRSILIGDNLTDLQAGAAAGISRLVLVLTGLGTKMLPELEQAGLPQVEIYEDVQEALHHLISTAEKDTP